MKSREKYELSLRKFFHFNVQTKDSKTKNLTLDFQYIFRLHFHCNKKCRQITAILPKMQSFQVLLV